MHHIALCTPCIALVNYGHLLDMQVDHVESESEFQAEQVVRMLTLLGSRQAPVPLTTVLEFCL
jgi:hypothetical protein